MKKIKYITLFLALITSVSCAKWLDVTDKDVIPAEDLFKSEKGYKQQLTGIYNVMANADSYGLRLSMSVTDALAQYWGVTNSSQEVVAFVKGDYKTATAEAGLLAVWSRQYEAIANANILLEKLGESNTMGLIDYDIIKGEGLALRAFLHFDLLRLFGPVIKNSPEGLSIPYRTVFDNNSTKALKASEVLKLIETDLLTAKALLANDPVKVNGRKIKMTDKSNLAFNFRGIRMNYYAVLGTLARLYQLQGNQSEAYKCAKEVIDAKAADGTVIFPLLARNDIMATNPDVMFSKEIIFAVYDKNITRKIGSACMFIDNDEVAQIYMNIEIEDAMKEAIYVTPTNSSGADHRYNRWFGKYFNYGTFIKHKPNDNLNSGSVTKDPLISLLRISEMYYIAAEAKIGVDNDEALSLLNAVRETRELVKIPEVATDNELREELFNECRKEYIGEGQLFYAYKRLFKDMKGISAIVPASVSRFVLPVPKEEVEFGNN